MTCREKLAMEHPDRVNALWDGGCCLCPHTYGYLDDPEYCMTYGNEVTCTKCWDREIDGTNSNDCITTTNEKEKNMATKNTKAELEKELETVKESKAELEKELQNLEKYKHYEDAAGEIHAFYMAFVKAGFGTDRAYELLKIMLQNAGQINFNATVTPSYRPKR